MNSIDKRRKFKKLLSRNKPIILIGVHDTLSAKLAEMANFQALWSSSFGFSATSGFPDANLLTFSENLEMIQRINRQCGLPLIADCDSGYGDLVIFNRVIKDYEDAGITGICIEDNVFPKRCSFYGKGVNRELVSVVEHTAKIKLAVKIRKDKNFFIVARTEAFIAGYGLREALKRATAYAKAGADAICIHSKKDKPSEVMEFARNWKLSTPLVAIPTTYYTTSPQELYRLGYKVLIYANQLIRGSIRAMKMVLQSMKNEQTKKEMFAHGITDLEEIFKITGVEEMKKLERKFY